jgi:hypothetical protein
MAYTENEFLEELRVYVFRKYGTQTKAAEAWGLTQGFVSSVLSGRKNPTAEILEDVGYELVPYTPKYRKVKPS